MHATEQRAMEGLYIPMKTLPKMDTHDKHQAIGHKSIIRQPSDEYYYRHN